MPWVKLDDGFFSHPKAVSAGKNGRALFIAGLCHAAGGLTDGRIDKTALPLLLVQADVPRTTVAKLVELGWWTDHDDHWMIHEFLDYQRSAADVAEDRKKARERMRKARAAKKPPPRSPDVRPNNDRTSDEVPEKFGEGFAGSSGNPVPSRPSSDLHALNTTTGVPDVTAPPGGGGRTSAETRAAQALAIAADQAVATGHPNRPDAYRASIIRRMATDGTEQRIIRLATDHPELDATELAATIGPPGTTGPPPTHPAIHATTHRHDCPDCSAGQVLDDTGTAQPCPTCNPITTP